MSGRWLGWRREIGALVIAMVLAIVLFVGLMIAVDISKSAGWLR